MSGFRGINGAGTLEVEVTIGTGSIDVHGRPPHVSKSVTGIGDIHVY